MCRFLAYLGCSPVVLSDLIDRPANSLIKQSRAPRLCAGMSADGFGLSWYQHDMGKEPGLYKSTQPAWNDANLRHLSNKIKSTCFLGHVRASTVGEVSFANCHPFVFGEYSFVHNGTIREFDKYRRAWLAELDQDFFEAILGQTDSELLFYLILQEIRRGLDWMGAIRKVFRKIQAAQESHGDEVFSFLNIALTDGKSLVATRYATKSETPLSLHYAVGKTVCSGERVFTEESQHQQIGPAHQSLSRAVIIASEALTDYAPEWEVLPEGKMLLVDDHFKIQIEDI